MSNTHVELIEPSEKLSGYRGPTEPAPVSLLLANVQIAAQKWPGIPTVWKVLQSSVNWKRYAETRRLYVDGRVIPCRVIGSVKDWWFVSVDTTEGERALTSLRAKALD